MRNVTMQARSSPQLELRCGPVIPIEHSLPVTDESIAQACVKSAYEWLRYELDDAGITPYNIERDVFSTYTQIASYPPPKTYPVKLAFTTGELVCHYLHSKINPRFHTQRDGYWQRILHALNNEKVPEYEDYRCYGLLEFLKSTIETCGGLLCVDHFRGEQESRDMADWEMQITSDIAKKEKEKAGNSTTVDKDYGIVNMASGLGSYLAADLHLRTKSKDSLKSLIKMCSLAEIEHFLENQHAIDKFLSSFATL